MHQVSVSLAHEETLVLHDPDRVAATGGLDPSAVPVAQTLDVWWLGPCGHEWRDSPNRRTRRGNGCVICSGEVIRPGVNDLATTHPELAAPLDSSRAAGLTASDIGIDHKSSLTWVDPDGGTSWGTPAERLRSMSATGGGDNGAAPSL